ncbi:MAG TPA: YeeE/YedE thiosulfate transporter family protein [Polyangiaceae bacterium]
MTTRVGSDRYWNPYVCGVLLGVILYVSFLVTGHGLGASGGLSRMVTAGVKTFATNTVNENAYFASLGGGDKATLDNWLVWEVLGVIVGGALSGLLAGRFRLGTQRGPQLTARMRWLFALLGGLLVGWGTQLSRGCTSGQALSGGAVLSVGSWAFMFAVFGGGYAVAYPLRRLWR